MTVKKFKKSFNNFRSKINNRPVRSSQLITTWGIGSVQPFPNDDSFMLLGLDAWQHIYESFDNKTLSEHIIKESRLARRLGVKNFRKPAIYDSNNPSSSVMPYYRFPLWHVCPKCGYLEKLDERQRRDNQNTICKKIYGQCKDSKEDIQLVPSRFVLICENGHIDDFPYDWWIIRKSGKKRSDLKKMKLRLTGGSFSSTILQMKLKCYANDITVPLDDLYFVFNDKNNSTGYPCNGAKPWLGITSYDKDECDDCDSRYNVTYRNALNVHSKIIKSSISLPSIEELFPKNVTNEIEDNLDLMIKYPETINEIVNRISSRTNIVENQLKNFIENKIDDFSKDYTELEFRNEEYQILKTGGGRPSDELFFAEAKNQSFENDILNKLISSISIVHRLTETNAFIGFKRLVGGDIAINQSDDEICELKEKLSIDQNLGWLPAYQAKGEGIFINFDDDALNNWESSDEVEKRIHLLDRNHNQYLDSRGKDMIELNPRYSLIHSFSHLLIEKLSYHCGYGAASLKEKIYCSLSKDGIENMNGLLIYTVGGGDGSLGGLSNLADGNSLEKIIIQSLLDTTWCSSDPICIQSEGQGNSMCNLAACHNCLLLPETSCESFNIILDRKLLCDNTKEGCGYFSELINEELEKL